MFTGWLTPKWRGRQCTLEIKKNEIKNNYTIYIFTLTVFLTLLGVGFKTPPNKLKSSDISKIHSVSVNNHEIVKLTIDELIYWQSLEFELASMEYPGETPDFVIDLLGEKNRFTAMYNVGDDIVFFSFVSEIKYGFFNSPPLGGWTKPLYKIRTTDKILNLLKIDLKKNKQKSNTKKQTHD